MSLSQHEVYVPTYAFSENGGTCRWWCKEKTARGGNTIPHSGCFLLTSHPSLKATRSGSLWLVMKGTSGKVVSFWKKTLLVQHKPRRKLSLRLQRGFISVKHKEKWGSPLLSSWMKLQIWVRTTIYGRSSNNIIRKTTRGRHVKVELGEWFMNKVQIWIMRMMFMHKVQT